MTLIIVNDIMPVNIITTHFVVRGCVFNPVDGHCNQYVHKLATPKAATKLFHLFCLFRSGAFILVSRSTV